jgi:ABC-type dipeptide/oligopeptide/nickel transport system ATPase component
VGLYLPHDLATAYQTSRNIVMLYRGSVVEAGDVALVVKHPYYPYTQFFTSSIPLASTERTWTT